MVRGRSAGHYWGIVLDGPDAHALARFYEELLGWKVFKDEPNWVTLAPADGVHQQLAQLGGVSYLSFQSPVSAKYVRPVWPAAEGQQQMMMHLDVGVGDLDAAVADAMSMGATPAEYQPQKDVRVMLDPAGHPFCLYVER